MYPAPIAVLLFVMCVHLGGPTPSATPVLAGSASVAGSTSVASYGAKANGTGDSTAAFLRAEDAALASTFRFRTGPTGSPQAVVYVPPGTYNLLRLTFRSNIRMEVSAGRCCNRPVDDTWI